MAMVYITNGETVSKVPAAAFHSTYKKLGFRLVDEKATEPKVEKTPVETKQEEVEEEVEEAVEEVEEEEEAEEEDNEAEFVEELLEKPLTQWSTDELKEFVRIKEIDTNGAKKTSEVRSIVKKFLDEQDKAAANS